MNTPEIVAWRQVHDAILSGIVHDLNGRVTALDGLIRITLGDRDDGAVALLRREVEQIESLAAILRALPRVRRDRAEAVVTSDVIRTAVQLALRDARFSGAKIHEPTQRGPALLAVIDRLTELLLYSMMLWRPAAEYDPLEVWLEWDVDAPVLRVTAGSEQEPDAMLMRVLEVMAADSNATVTLADGVLVLTFETLEESRRRAAG